MKYLDGTITTEYSPRELIEEHKKILVKLAKGEEIDVERIEDLLGEAMIFVSRYKDGEIEESLKEHNYGSSTVSN